MRILRVCAIAIFVSLVGPSVGLLALSPAQAQNVNIIVNGQQVSFDQPPIERGGRVFVPLRGVFERLGASVVYDNGTINATGNGRNIQLHIGSTSAIVNGQTTYLDVAPFLVGARTLVPLRFISESLGANVNWDGNSHTVTVAMAGQQYTPPPTAAPSNTVQLTNVNPPRNGSAQSLRPAISGGFSQPVDPNSVRITLDGRDVSSTSYVSANDFLFTPTFDLPTTQHTVRITGNSSSGVAFNRGWNFSSGTNTGGNYSVNNYLNNLNPAPNTTVGSNFTVYGTTIPNSAVHIAATGSALLGGIFQVTSGTYTADTNADGNGNFSQAISLNAVSGGAVTVRITSIAPGTGAAATATLNLKG
jgi:Copper amine oxidase N-terminal domain